MKRSIGKITTSVNLIFSTNVKSVRITVMSRDITEGISVISKENSLETQIPPFALLGPFMMVVTLTTLLINPVHLQLSLPLIALTGISLCWKWKIQGLFASLALLTVTLFYKLFFSSPPERVFWDILSSVALGLSFSIIALCYKEIEEILGKTQQESASIIQKFSNVNENARLLEDQRNQELHEEIAKGKELQQKLNELERQLNEQIASSLSSEQTSEKMREKMNNVSLQNESLLRELFQKRHECEKLLKELGEQAELTQMALENQKKTFEASIERLQQELIAVQTSKVEIVPSAEVLAPSEMVSPSAHETAKERSKSKSKRARRLTIGQILSCPGGQNLMPLLSNQ